MNHRVSEADVARILSLIASPPNLRDDPNDPNSLIQLFDGGLLETITGLTRYEFMDGTQATVGVMPFLSVSITFPDGRFVSISQAESPV